MERIRQFRTRREALDCLRGYDPTLADALANVTKSEIEVAIPAARVEWVKARLAQLRQALYSHDED